jgi:hypothetical protein
VARRVAGTLERLAPYGPREHATFAIYEDRRGSIWFARSEGLFQLTTVGLRWDYITPWAGEHHQTTTFVCGVNSKDIPGRSLAGRFHDSERHHPDPLDNFCPRLGLPCSPGWSDGLLAKLTGGPGKTSILLGGGHDTFRAAR